MHRSYILIGRQSYILTGRQSYGLIGLRSLLQFLFLFVTSLPFYPRCLSLSDLTSGYETSWGELVRLVCVFGTAVDICTLI